MGKLVRHKGKLDKDTKTHSRLFCLFSYDDVKSKEKNEHHDDFENFAYWLVNPFNRINRSFSGWNDGVLTFLSPILVPLVSLTLSPIYALSALIMGAVTILTTLELIAKTFLMLVVLTLHGGNLLDKKSQDNFHHLGNVLQDLLQSGLRTLQFAFMSIIFPLIAGVQIALIPARVITMFVRSVMSIVGAVKDKEDEDLEAPNREYTAKWTDAADDSEYIQEQVMPDDKSGIGGSFFRCHML